MISQTAINSAVSCCSLPTDRSRQFLLFPPPGKLLPQQNSRRFISVSVSFAPETSTDEASVKQKQELTPDRIRELKQNEEIIQILYIAEQYLGKTLTPTESQKLLFFYDGLGLSADLIEYLLEYCVSHNHKSIRYIEKVAIAWAENGVTTVEQAKQS